MALDLRLCEDSISTEKRKESAMKKIVFIAAVVFVGLAIILDGGRSERRHARRVRA